jgi:hypothetical protein
VGFHSLDRCTKVVASWRLAAPPLLKRQVRQREFARTRRPYFLWFSQLECFRISDERTPLVAMDVMDILQVPRNGFWLDCVVAGGAYQDLIVGAIVK